MFVVMVRKKLSPYKNVPTYKNIHPCYKTKCKVLQTTWKCSCIQFIQCIKFYAYFSFRMIFKILFIPLAHCYYQEHYPIPAVSECHRISYYLVYRLQSDSVLRIRDLLIIYHTYYNNDNTITITITIVILFIKITTDWQP